jgi:hypothetical protein
MVFILSINAENCVPTTYDEFSGERYDAIINCIGIGDPAVLKIAKDQIFRLTEYYDNLILDNLKNLSFDSFTLISAVVPCMALILETRLTIHLLLRLM